MTAEEKEAERLVSACNDPEGDPSEWILPETVRIDVVGRSIIARNGITDIPRLLSRMRPINWPLGWLHLRCSRAGFDVVVHEDHPVSLSGGKLRLGGGVSIVAAEHLVSTFQRPHVAIVGAVLSATVSTTVVGRRLGDIVAHHALEDLADATIASISVDGEGLATPILLLHLDPDWRTFAVEDHGR